MLQNKIYQNYSKEILRTFLTILFSLTIIAWTVRAVNFLDLIVESGYPVVTYFQYSILNIFGILTKFIPLSFLLAITMFILKQIQDNEFVILWTSGVKKIDIVHLFFKVSLVVTIFYILFSIFLTPLALNKSRQLLGEEKFTSFLPTVRIQQFSDSFTGLTFIVDEKYENQVKNIFLQDNLNILKNISSTKIEESSNTIVAKRGLVEDGQLVLLDGKIISTKNLVKNDFIKFDQINIDLNNLKNTTIKKPKIQETSTLSLIKCLKENLFTNYKCTTNFKEEILPVLNRRLILPMFIPVLALVSSLLLIKTKKNIFFNKISIFSYSFLILLYSELIIRFTGLNSIANYIFLISPIIFSFLSYYFLKYKFSIEANFNEKSSY